MTARVTPAQSLLMKFEQRYLASARSPMRFPVEFASGLAVACGLVAPAPFRGWFIAGVFAWCLVIGPFLSRALPFSPAMHEYWRQRRAHAPASNYTGYMAFALALLAVAVVEQCRGAVAERDRMAMLGLVMLAIGSFGFITSLYRRRKQAPLDAKAMQP